MVRLIRGQVNAAARRKAADGRNAYPGYGDQMSTRTRRLFRRLRDPHSMPFLQLLVVHAARGSGRTQFDQHPVLIAANGAKAARDQEISGSLGFKPTAEVIAKVHDVCDSEGGNVRKHRFKPGAVAVDVGDRSPFHHGAFCPESLAPMSR